MKKIIFFFSVLISSLHAQSETNVFDRTFLVAGYDWANMDSDHNFYVGANFNIFPRIHLQGALGIGQDSRAKVFSVEAQFDILRLKQHRFLAASNASAFYWHNDPNDRFYVTQTFGLGYHVVMFKGIGVGVDLDLLGVDYFRTKKSNGAVILPQNYGIFGIESPKEVHFKMTYLL